MLLFNITGFDLVLYDDKNWLLGFLVGSYFGFLMLFYF